MRDASESVMSSTSQIGQADELGWDYQYRETARDRQAQRPRKLLRFERDERWATTHRKKDGPHKRRSASAW
jgi:hypothetical protein